MNLGLIQLGPYRKLASVINIIIYGLKAQKIKCEVY